MRVAGRVHVAESEQSKYESRHTCFLGTSSHSGHGCGATSCARTRGKDDGNAPVTLTSSAAGSSSSSSSPFPLLAALLAPLVAFSLFRADFTSDFGKEEDDERALSLVLPAPLLALAVVRLLVPCGVKAALLPLLLPFFRADLGTTGCSSSSSSSAVVVATAAASLFLLFLATLLFALLALVSSSSSSSSIASAAAGVAGATGLEFTVAFTVALASVSSSSSLLGAAAAAAVVAVIFGAAVIPGALALKEAYERIRRDSAHTL